MAIKTLFEPIDAMALRTQFGELVDRVVHTRQRFVIQRRGKAKALLVPIEDGELIADALEHRDDSLDAVYAAFDKVKGMVTDPAMRDASGTVDIWLYGDRSLDQVGEDHGA